jgi:D-alanyl-D-alanine carboxypeptidase
MGWHDGLGGYHLAGVALIASAGLIGVDMDSAKAAARQATHARPTHAQPAARRVVHGSDYHPPTAAIVVDDNIGQAIYEANPDEPRHPASVTKIMTLYVLFEQIEAGKFKLDTPLPISAHAAGQAPVKLGLKAGQTITVDDAIRAMVTKSANDAAAVVGEAIGGGDEAEGARLMTLKAKTLGMTHTTYVNASGLPAEEQITTARDQALLGLAIQNRYPNFYRYFSTPSFKYHGVEMRNHNALLGNVKGVDGIKTGFTEASGYNLVASVRRDDKHIVAVVLGGTSNATRDAFMRRLIEEQITRASTQRTASPIVEAANPGDAPAANPIGTAPDAVVASTVNFGPVRVEADRTKQKSKLSTARLDDAGPAPESNQPTRRTAKVVAHIAQHRVARHAR